MKARTSRYAETNSAIAANRDNAATGHIRGFTGQINDKGEDMNDEIRNACRYYYKAGFWKGYAISFASTSALWLILIWVML